MSYQTMRDVHIKTGRHSPREISAAFCESFDPLEIGLHVYCSTSDAPCGTLDFDGICTRAWYSEYEELCEFSRRFPSAIITVHCVGEEPGDIWQNRYQAGRISRRERKRRWGLWSEINIDAL